MRQAKLANARGADVARDSSEDAGIQRSCDSRTARARRRLRSENVVETEPSARSFGETWFAFFHDASLRIASSPTASPGPKNRGDDAPAAPSAESYANASSKSFTLPRVVFRG
jgi:hypothetical protein